MNPERRAESLKVLLLFGVLLLCGLDLDTPAPGLEIAVSDTAMALCAQDAGCAPEDLLSRYP